MNSGIFTVGVVILILGIFAFGYAAFFEEMLEDEGYGGFGRGIVGSYAFPLIGLGIVVMLIGALIPSVTTTTHSGTRTTPAHIHHGTSRRTVTTISED